MNQNPHLPTSVTYGIGNKCFRITREYVTERPFEGYWQFTCHRNVIGLPLIGYFRSTSDALDAAAKFASEDTAQ
jgi:hypothetical protein